MDFPNNNSSGGALIIQNVQEQLIGGIFGKLGVGRPASSARSMVPQKMPQTTLVSYLQQRHVK